MKGRKLGRATRLVLTPAQRDKLLNCTKGRGGYQSLCRRVYDGITTVNGQLVSTVYEADMERMREIAARDDHGTWQDLCREILAAN
jgi:hypothetical protein